ncbi:chemotaxis protein CheW [Candidatus Poribacteria bacterium]|nr:chemotaxis protein CheW [Candidatus Poribacteria bacterium]
MPVENKTIQEQTPSQNQEKSFSSELAGKYLTFWLNNEEYGIEILKVKEIIGLMDITRVPRMPEHIKGVLNLRGKIIPVIDLKTKFNMGVTEYTEKTCIIVVYLSQDGQHNMVGILVDAVSEVVDISDQQIEQTPSFNPEINTEFVMGIGKTEQNIKILLDIVKAVSF